MQGNALLLHTQEEKARNRQPSTAEQTLQHTRKNVKKKYLTDLARSASSIACAAEDGRVEEIT